MRISGIGFLDSRGIIQVHKNIIEGLSIFDGSLLFGIYYPRSKDDKKDIFKNDFMFTAIPYSLWPRTSRMIIKFAKQSEGVKAISKFLAENNVSILHSVSNRSAHRYSTWDLHIAFDDLKNEKLTYIEEGSYYQETKKRNDEIVKTISETYGSIIFTDPKDIDLKDPIIYRLNTALHYFYYETEKSNKNGNKESTTSKLNKEVNTIYSSFTARYAYGNLTTNTGRKISNILSMAHENQELQQIPTIVFVEAESHYLNFRVRIIPRNKLNNFFKLSLYYERNGEGENYYTTRGLLSFITSNFPEKFKIWKFYNQLYECRDTYGCGRINFILENQNQLMTEQSLISDIETLINSLNYRKPEELKHIKFWCKTKLIYPAYIRKHFKGQRDKANNFTYDVFISYSSANEVEANTIKDELGKFGLSCFMAPHEINTGDIFTDKLKTGLNNSREVCLLYSDKSKESSWVKSEWGAAWFMNKVIVPILLDISDKEIKKDERLFAVQHKKYRERELSEYANGVLQRRLQFYLDNENFEYYH